MMKRGNNKIKVETPSTTKKRKIQDNKKTAKSRKKLFSTQTNTILDYFLKSEESQRDLSEENNEPTNSSVSEENNEPTNSSVKETTTSLHNQSSPGLSNKNETSNSSVFEISTPSFYLKIKENKPALSSRALNVAEQAINMSTNSDLPPSARQLNLTKRDNFQYLFKSKIKSTTEKEQLKIIPAEGPGRSVKTLPRPTFVATNQSKVEMKKSSNIGNSTTVNNKGEFNTETVKDKEVKGTLNDNGVIFISDDSDDEKGLPQIPTITRNNLIGKDKSDYNQTNDENTIESSSLETYSLSGSGSTVMFDENSLSESEHSPNTPNNSSVIEKEKVKQDSIRTEDDINKSVNEKESGRHHGSDITLDGEETQRSENNIFASSDESNVMFNDLKKTKRIKLTGSRDKFSVFATSKDSGSDYSRNFSRSSASESDNTEAIITKMKLNKRKKITRKRNKTISNFSSNESDSDFPENINYNSSKESDSDVAVKNTHKSLQRKSMCKRKITSNQSWKVVLDGSNSDSSEITTSKTDCQDASSKNQLERTNLKKSRITLEDESKTTFGNKGNLIKRDIGRMAYFRAFYENVIIQYDTYTERIISLNEIEVVISDESTSQKSDGFSDNSQDYLSRKIVTSKRFTSSGIRSGKEIDLHSSRFIENYEQDKIRKQTFYSSVSESDSNESLASTRTEFLLREDSSLVDSDSESDVPIRTSKRKGVRKNKCILSSNSDSESNKPLEPINKSQRRDKKSSNLAKKSTYQRSRQTLAKISGSRECKYTKIEEDGSSNPVSGNNRYTNIKTDREKMAPMTYNKIDMKSYIGVCQVALYQTLKQFVSKTRSNYLDLGLDFDYDLLCIWQKKTIEESMKKNELLSCHVIRENTSLVGLPEPNVLWLLVDEVLEAPGINQSIDAYCLLKKNNLLQLSDDKDADQYKFILRNDYDNNKDANFQLTPTLDYILRLVRDNVTERKQLILEYVVALLAYNLETFVKNTKGVVKDIKKLCKLLLWKMIWEESPDCHMNNNIKQITETLNILSMQENFEKVEDSVDQLLKLLEMIALIFSWKEEIKSKERPGFCCYYLTIELQKVYDDVLFKNNNVKTSTKRFFVDNLKPAWLALHVIEYLIRRYSRCLCKEEMEYLLEGPLSLEKIIYCYFFIYPSHDNIDMQDNKSVWYPLKGHTYLNTSASESYRNLDDKKRVSKLYSNFKTLPNPNKRNVKGENALHIACKLKNRSHQVKELLENGFDPNLLDNYGWTALHEASNFGHVASVRELLKSTALYIYDASNGSGMSVLHDAVQNNHIKVVKLLLQKGGKRLLNMKTNNNETALDLAVSDDMHSLLKQYSNSEAEKSDEKPYKNVSRLPSFRVTEFLYLLMKLVLIYTEYISSEQVTVNRHEIEYQIDAFKRHINKISYTETLKMKVYTSCIYKTLRHKVPVQQEMEEIMF